MSETAKCRERLAPFCSGFGIDLGYGGDPIVPWAITFDLPRPYAHEGEAPQNLAGDARDLSIFVDNVFDFVFSSHLLEDFVETEAVLREWARVLKPGGNLVLYCPDERRYRKVCEQTGQAYNEAHKLADFGLAHVRRAVANISTLYFITALEESSGYSFDFVARKR